MHRPGTRRRAFRIALASALLGTMLGACSTAGGPLGLGRGPSSNAIVQDQTIVLAEAAVLGAPTDPALRARLGRAYLAAGRFASAAGSFADAVTLGDATPATALRLALALTGSGRADEAAALLFDRSEDLPAADLGLALALAGEVQPAMRFMQSAIRDGETSAALRQNLALTYALAGRWREARLMAAVDVPANALGARMEQWAALAMNGDTRQRLALVLRVPAGVADAGVPVELALAADRRAVKAAAGVARAASASSATVPASGGLAEVAADAEADALLVLPADAGGDVTMAAQPAVLTAAPLAVEWEPVGVVSSSVVTRPTEVASVSETPRILPAYFRRQHRSGGARW